MIIAGGSHASKRNFQVDIPGDEPNSIVTTWREADGHTYIGQLALQYSKQLFDGIWYTRPTIQYQYDNSEFIVAGERRKEVNHTMFLSWQNDFILSRRCQWLLTAYFNLSSPMREVNGVGNGWEPKLALDITKKFRSAELSVMIADLIPVDRETIIHTPTYSYYFSDNMTKHPSLHVSFTYYFGNRYVRKNFLLQDANNL